MIARTTKTKKYKACYNARTIKEHLTLPKKSRKYTNTKQQEEYTTKSIRRTLKTQKTTNTKRTENAENKKLQQGKNQRSNKKTRRTDNEHNRRRQTKTRTQTRRTEENTQ